jgi:hypothetical protein
LKNLPENLPEEVYWRIFTSNNRASVPVGKNTRVNDPKAEIDMKKAIKPNISKRVFWDVDFESLDYDKDRLFIIDKVMNYGLWDDFVATVRYYGKEVIRKEIVKSPYLKKDVLNFLCFYLSLQPSDFECYTRRQLQEPHWAY